MKRWGFFTASALGLAACGSPSGQPSFDLNYGVGETKTLEGSNVELTYLEKGEGTPVVFYYGRVDARYWQFQIERFAETHRAVTFDYEVEQPVQESPVAPHSLIAALEALRAELRVERFDFVVHSFSGRQALEIAIARPDLFNTLILEEPAGAPSPDSYVPPIPAACEREYQDAAELQACQFYNGIMGPGGYETFSPALRQYLVQLQARDNQGVAAVGGEDFVALLNELLSRPICDELPALPMPILFVRGAQTPAWLQGMLDAYEACLPLHETARIAGAAHMVHLEQPADYNRAVLDFLGRHGNSNPLPRD